MTETRRCIVIPAIKKNAVIPDQLVKRLNGKITCMRLVIESFSSIEYLVIQVKAFDIRVQRYSQNILAVS